MGREAYGSARSRVIRGQHGNVVICFEEQFGDSLYCRGGKEDRQLGTLIDFAWVRVGQMGSGTRGRDDMGREFRLWYGTKLLSGQHTAPFRLGAVVGLHTSCAWIGCSR